MPGEVVPYAYWDSFETLLLERARRRSPLSLTDAVTSGLDKGNQLTVRTVISEFELVNEIAEAGLFASPDVRVLGKVGLITIHDPDGSWLLTVWPTGKPHVYYLAATIPFTDERWRRALRRVSKSRVILPFDLNESDFDSIASELNHVASVEVSRLTARVYEDHSSYARGWPATPGLSRPTYERATAEIAGVASVRTATLQVGHLLSMHLRRDAGATYYSGDFKLFNTVVLQRMASAADERRRLLRNRERRRGKPAATALAIELERPLLRDPAVVSELLREMARVQAFGIAVLHRNPYLHVAVTDYSDGSNFDALVTDDDRIVIYPGYRSTPGALARFTRALGDRFAARAVTEVAAMQAPTLDELLTTG